MEIPRKSLWKFLRNLCGNYRQTGNLLTRSTQCGRSNCISFYLILIFESNISAVKKTTQSSHPQRYTNIKFKNIKTITNALFYQLSNIKSRCNVLYVQIHFRSTNSNYVNVTLVECITLRLTIIVGTSYGWFSIFLTQW